MNERFPNREIDVITVDDDEIFLDILDEYISRRPELNLLKAVNDAQSAMQLLSQVKADLLLLDINLPGINGMELLRSAPSIPQVILVTAHAEYAAEAFDYDVTDYLVKPVKYQRFSKAIDKAVTIHNQRLAPGTTKHIFIKVNSRLVKVLCNNIQYIESYGDYVKVHEKQKTHTVLGTLNHMQNSLNRSEFMRIHRKYIVRLEGIAAVEGYFVKLDNGVSLPVSRPIKQELLQRL